MRQNHTMPRGRATWFRAAALALLGAALAACSDRQDLAGPRLLPTGPSRSTSVTGAAFTTVDVSVDGDGHCKNGNPSTNCNIYDGKQYVWANGGPGTAYVGDGTYFFAMLAPGGQHDPNDGAANNLSDDFDAYTNRTFSVAGGAVSYSGTHDFDGNKIRLMDYADTPNPGGVYILAICSLADGYPVAPSACKYDAFKATENGTVTQAADLTATKDATGAYKNTYTWMIAKAVDKTMVKQLNGSATFNYTVTVSHDAGTISDVKVTGTISVFNPNVDLSLQPVDVTISSVTDQLSDGTICTVTDGGSQTLTAAETHFTYTCTLSALPQGALDNTVTVTWPSQLLDNGTLLDGSSAHFTFSSIAFTATTIDDQVSVTDDFDGTVSTLGTVAVGGTNPTEFKYSHIIDIPSADCLSYDNTATFTTSTTATTGSDSKEITVCRIPPQTGALTMGFWQNKNGQGIITGQAGSGVCPSATWLRQLAPFQDLSATATCAQVGTYVTNVIKAANAAGAAMNAMLKAQALATALDVYFSDPALGGNKIKAPGAVGAITIDLTEVCSAVGNCAGSYINVGAAFGGATSLTVNQILAYAASQSNAGGSTWYGQVKAMQELAKDTFDAINNGVAYTP